MFKTLSLLSLLGVLGVSAAQAQSGQLFQAQVPFAFQMEHKTFAAGGYRLAYDLGNHVLSLRSVSHPSEAALVLALSASDQSKPSPAELVFRCYGKACYLAELRQGSDYGRSVLELPVHEPAERLSFLTHAIPLTAPGK